MTKTKNKSKHKVGFISKFISHNVRLSLCLCFDTIILLGVLLTYYFLPILLNYGPGTINTEFDLEFSSGISFFTQFVLIYVALVIIGTIFILWQTKDFKVLNTLKIGQEVDKNTQKKLDKIIFKCMTIPQYIFAIISLFPCIAIGIVFFFLGFTSFADFKVPLVVLTVSLLAASLGYIFTKGIFRTVLTSINNQKKIEKSSFSLKTMLIVQITSLIFICVLYTFLLSYSSNMEDKSRILKEHYIYEVNSIIENYHPSTKDSLKQLLNNMDLISEKDTVFLIDENGKFDNFNNSEVTDFFVKYAEDLSSKYDNIIYDYYGTEYQGVSIPVTIGNTEVKVIIRYDLTNHFLSSIFLNLLIVLVYCAFAIYYFSRSITKDISTVEMSMKEIATNSQNRLNDKLPVTSSDELGDLIVAFNDIQELTKQNINKIENNQQMLLEKERLASLGQMIGGIAHNLKTPIMSISGASEGLVELVGEYIASISNPQVTKEDHQEIAKDMLEWITKIKMHTSYMSDIITAVKGQASQLATTESSDFTLYDLSKKVDILVKHEVKKALLILETDIKCDPSLTLNGDINNLIQVIINLISNSIMAYDGRQGEKIYFTIDANEKNVYITVKDNGCGMTNETKEKLFKEMFTTKGKNGTGLGLYMSYSTIKGKFGGDITFDSELKKGTTFTVTIPFNK